MLKIELMLSVLALTWAFIFPNIGARGFESVENFLRPLAERKNLSILAVGILAVIARLAVLPVLPVPTPAIHDEFSYLLMADTFAHGRLANPTPPLWVHFETFHENMIPTYVSKYFPAQGVFLAIGQVVFGHPFWGVVLSSALMCAAICWMLQGWMSPGWALLGGILAVIRLGVFSYWADSYWGGAVTAFGGALVLGALPRVKKFNRARDSISIAVGVSLLATSRPYEGMFVAAPVAASLLIWLVGKNAPSIAQTLRNRVLPGAAILALTTAGMAYYNFRTTGRAIQAPYTINEKTYAASPIFPWHARPPKPSYSHFVMERFYNDWVVSVYEFDRSHPMTEFVIRNVKAWAFYLGPCLILLVLVGICAIPIGLRLKDVAPSTRFLVAVLLFALLGMSLPVFFIPHYLAPATAAIYAMLLVTMRQLRTLELRNRTVGIAIGRTMIFACLILVPVRIIATRSTHVLTPAGFKTWASSPDGVSDRSALIDELDRSSHQDLMLVRYRVDHNAHNEWVYNGADIEHQKIIWARDMGPEKNQELIDYYKGRRVWLLEPDETPPRLEPYAAQFKTKITPGPAAP